MKNYYILPIGLFFAASINAQVAPQANFMGEIQKATPKTFVELQPVYNTINKQNLTRRAVDYNGFIEIGTTYYDLQTNSAMPHRLVINADGTIAATWTTHNSATTNFPTRGTGFNIKTATGAWAPSSAERVESSARTGWPMVGFRSNGNPFVIGHFATSGGFYRTEAPSPGTRPSGASQNILVESPYKPIWGRAGNQGDTVHLICSYSDSSAAGDVRAPLRKGIRAPMVYSRSFDAGLTWNIQHQMLPDYDSTITNNGGADQYAIAVRDSIVAIVNGDQLQGVIAWKSTDHGNTFTRIMAETFPYAPWADNKLTPDTPFTNDGSVDVIIDNDGNMHAFWGLARILNDDSTDDGSYSFYPAYQGLVHWKEGDINGTLVAGGNQFDRDGDGINSLEQSTYAALSSGAVPSGLSTVARLTNTSAMRSPNAAIDANGNIFCVFSVPIEGTLDHGVSELGANYREIGIIYSTDGGVNWSAPQNLTQIENREDDFASIAIHNGTLHMMWQSDEYCGNNLSNNDVNSGNHPIELNTVLYQAIPLSQILNNEIGMIWNLSAKKPNTGALSVVSSYPNPATDVNNVLIYLTQPGAINWTISNINGQVVNSGTQTGLNRGNHTIAMDCSNLTSGVYIYTINSGASTVSSKFIVK